MDAPPCKLCGEPILEGRDAACALCHAPHHLDCWEYTGLCSAYGCGGITTVPFSTALVPERVTIDEHSVASVDRRAWVEGLRRRVAARAQDLPATMAAGVGGGLVSAVAMVGVLATLLGTEAVLGGALTGYAMIYAAGLVTAGAIYGLAAPYLAPYQHRNPVRVVLLTGGASLACFMVGGLTDVVLFVATVVFGVAAASTLAEALFGPHSRLGRRVGRASTPLRYATTALTFFVCSAVASWSASVPMVPVVFQELLVWTLFATLAAGHSLEVGREEYRKHLIALAEGSGASPSA